MKETYTTSRLHLRKLTPVDAPFILELVNTAGWLKFIGDRNIHSLEDALNYIERINSNPNIKYRVTVLNDTGNAIGLVTFIKREYLDHPDIGFAFLPAFGKQGYATEASQVVLNDLLQQGIYTTILATTIPGNSASVHLLKKLGLRFSRQINYEGTDLHVYSIDKSPAGKIHLRRTSSDDADFQQLVALLDADLRERDGDDHAFYAQFNKIATIRHAVVCLVDEKPVGCGAFREFESGKVEIKRMYVMPEQRCKGIAGKILHELENWAAELGYQQFVLETGKNQPEAIHLYQKSGYTLIPNYGQYENIESSVCMAKTLTK